MSFVDQVLARRLESAEEIPQVRYAELYKKLRPEVGASAEPFCGGHMIFAGLNSPIGRTVGAGFDGSCSAQELDRMEAFYRSHGAPSQIDVCPLTDAPLLELLKERRYSMLELNNLLFRPLQTDDLPASRDTGARIRRGSREEGPMLAEIVHRSFHPQQGSDGPADGAQMIAPMFQFEEVIPFAAEVDGVAVACAFAVVISQYKIAAFAGAGTLTGFRGRGLQTALLRARMKVARDSGCEFAVIVTQGGTVSQRNAERLGFRVAYSKATLIKPIAKAE